MEKIKKYDGKSLVQFLEEEGISLFFRGGKGVYQFMELRTGEVRTFDFPLERKDRVALSYEIPSQVEAEQGVFFQMKKTGRIFCAEKEENLIHFYEVKRNKEKTLMYCASMEIGKEMGEETSVSKRFRQLMNGCSQSGFPLLYKKNTFSNYPYIYEKGMVGQMFSKRGTSEMIKNILENLQRKKYEASEEERALLSYPELTKEDLPVLSGEDYYLPTPVQIYWWDDKEQDRRISYVLEMLSPQICRISGVNLHKKTGDLLLASQIFLYQDEKGRHKETAFIRNISGEWVKTSANFIHEVCKEKRRFAVKGSEEGFLKYAIQNAKGAVNELISSSRFPFFEKLHAFPGIIEKMIRSAVTPLVANPKESSLEKAFGLSMGNLHALNDAFFLGGHQLLRGLKVLCKQIPSKMRNLNEQDFEKLLFLFKMFPMIPDAVFAMYSEKEAAEVLLSLSKTAFKKVYNNSQLFFGVLRPEIRESNISFYQEAKPRGYARFTLRSQIYYFEDYLDEVAEIFLKEEEVFLKTSLQRKKDTDLLENHENHMYIDYMSLYLKMLFFDENEEEAIRKILNLHIKKRGKLTESEALSVFQEYVGENASASVLQREIADMKDMSALFTKEELSAMGVKMSLSRKEIIRSHDILAGLYTMRKQSVNDEKIAEARERNLSLEENALSSEFIMILPESGKDLMKEGSYLGHCVASYMDKVGKGQTKILFVRRKNSPEIPLCTVELQKEEVVQIQGRFRTYPREDSVGEDKKIFDFIKDWAEKHEFNIAGKFHWGR